MSPCVRALTNGLHPSSRDGLGFAALSDGNLYVFGSGQAGNGLYRFSPAANTWTALSPSGSPPSPRREMGFAAAHDGVLYVFGGRADSQEIITTQRGTGFVAAGAQQLKLLTLMFGGSALL
jgi:hypothetical protein